MIGCKRKDEVMARRDRCLKAPTIQTDSKLEVASRISDAENLWNFKGGCSDRLGAFVLEEPAQNRNKREALGDAK